MMCTPNVCRLACLMLALVAPVATQDPPREWIEPATGHRLVRLSNEQGARFE